MSPIVLFVYNRPWHTRQTVEALLQNPLARQSTLYVFADGARRLKEAPKVEEVRQFVRRLTGFRRVHLSESRTNLGLANSVIRGVSEVVEREGRAIVMEDDLVCSAEFLAFMNDALLAYQTNPLVFSVSGYTYPLSVPPAYSSDVCLLPRASSWGWGTWADRWQRADWQVSDYEAFSKDPVARQLFVAGGEDLWPMLQKQQKGRIDSWAIRWTYAHYRHRAYCLSPVRSKIRTTGADDSGTHLGNTKRYDVTVGEAAYALPADPQPDPALIENLRRFFKPSPVRRLINWLTL